MLISKINTISFSGKIIDAHTHSGHWDKPSAGSVNGAEPYTLNDIFERADKVSSDGDEICKVIISNLDCIKEENGKPLADELSGNLQLLAECKDNPRAAALAVCQPKTGNVANIKKLFAENPGGFVGLKFHPLNSGLIASNDNYIPYLKFAQEKGLPCLFHSQVNVNNDGKLIKSNINIADPEIIYKAAQKAPKTPVIIGHMGAGWGESHTKAVDIIIQSLEKGDANLYADISWVDFNNPAKPALLDAIERLMHTTKGDKTDRLLFGTDAPIAEFYGDTELYPRVVRETKAAIRGRFGDKADELIEKIFYKNANELFFAPKNNAKQAFSKTKIGAALAGSLAVIGGIFYASSYPKSKKV